MKHLDNLAILLGIYVVVPIALAKYLVGATWTQVGIAYGVHLLFLALIGAGGSTWGEKIGWMLIIGMFTSIPAVPILSLILRVFGIGR